MKITASWRKMGLVVLTVVAIGVLVAGSVALGLYGPRVMNSSGSGSTGTSPGTQQVTLSQAVQTFKTFLVSLQNPNIALHEVEEYQYNFYASYYEKDTGNFAFQMLIWNPGTTGTSGMMGYGMMTGVAMPEPGPNMMWNTKYGMMNGMMGMMGGIRQGTSASMTVFPEQARTIAQQYLNASLAGKTAGDADTYYGYYNIDVLMNGSTFGMISVNGYTGQVWYHTWHGAYVQTVTLS